MICNCKAAANEQMKWPEKALSLAAVPDYYSFLRISLSNLQLGHDVMANHERRIFVGSCSKIKVWRIPYLAILSPPPLYTVQML